MNTISVIAYGSPGSFVRRVQENPTLAIAVLDALRGMLAMYDETDDCRELRNARAVLRLALDPPPESDAVETNCPRCEGSGIHHRLGLPSVECALCKGTGKMTDAVMTSLDT